MTAPYLLLALALHAQAPSAPVSAPVSAPGATEAPAAAAPAATVDNAAFKEGLAAYNDIEYEDAITKFATAAEDASLSSSDKSRVLVWLGVAHGQLGHFEEAKTAFDAAVALDPDVTIKATLPPKVQEVLEASRTAERERLAAAAAAGALTPTSETPAGEPLPVLLIAGGTVGAAGAVLLVAGVAAIAVSAATASGLGDQEEFQSVIKQRLDDANLQLGVGYGLTAVGVALLGVGGALIAVDLME